MAWGRNVKLNHDAPNSRCILCFKPIHNPDVVWYVWVAGHYIITTEEDLDDLGGEDVDEGMQPIGPECRRRLKKIIRPFLEEGG